MTTISIINLKGGTGKTISAANFAYILARYHKKRVLLIDADKQGNLSQYFRCYSKTREGLANLLNETDFDIDQAVYTTPYIGLDLITSNMELWDTAHRLNEAKSADAALILKQALLPVTGQYDYCIIDNAPAVDMVVLNSLVASDHVLIPIRLDKFSQSGMEDLLEQISVAKLLNPEIAIAGCFVTHYKHTYSMAQEKKALAVSAGIPVFDTNIRYSQIITQSAIDRWPLPIMNSRSWATIEYKKLVAEYMKRCPNRTPSK